MDILALHGQAMSEFDQRVRAVRADQWAAPTPCAAWDIRALVNHVVVEQLWAQRLLAGDSIADVGDSLEGDHLGAEPVEAWAQAAAAARAAWTAPDALARTVELSIGHVPTTVYAGQMTTDLAVHAWDLARATGADERLDPSLVHALHGMAMQFADQIRASGKFAPPVAVSFDASEQDQLLGLLGREPSVESRRHAS
jgi:uncharacterized protein (TIGR03086 family)